MTKKTNPTLIGAFFLGALALLVAGIVVFSKGALKELPKFMVYFDESVNGLSVGAPVKMSGVTVGKVTEVLVTASGAYTEKFISPVVIEIDPARILGPGGRPVERVARTTEELAQAGLRAQLNLQSLVTGQLYIELTVRPDTQPRYFADKVAFKPYPEIPSIRSNQEVIQNTIDEAISEFRKLPIKEMIGTLMLSLQHIEEILASPETRETREYLRRSTRDLDELLVKLSGVSRSLDVTLGDARQLIQSASARVNPLSDKLEQALASGNQVLQETRTAMAAVNDKRFQTSLDQALEELTRASRAISVLADYLQRHPNAVLSGKASSEE